MKGARQLAMHFPKMHCTLFKNFSLGLHDVSQNLKRFEILQQDELFASSNKKLTVYIFIVMWIKVSEIKSL